MFAQVIVDIATSNVDKIFDYKLNEPISVGSRVLVPFGNRKIEGYIISTSETTNYDEEKIKDVIKPLDAMPVITEEQLKLAKFMSARFYIGYADCFRLFLPPELRSGKVNDIFKSICVITNKIKAEEYLNNLTKQAKKQAELINLLLESSEGLEQAELNKLYSASVIKKLKDEKIVEVKLQQVRRSPYKDLETTENNSVVLTPLQNKVVNAIKSNPNSSFLLHGITGSGKTEVYMNIIEDTINNGKTAIMLVPEISLTPQVLFNFRKRFGDSVALLHSGLSTGERFDEWKRILLGEAKIVVGARSAIFCPIR
ncbi:MAG: DEAD/DEAH box helicase, partial [Christensenellales bacterium]